MHTTAIRAPAPARIASPPESARPLQRAPVASAALLSGLGRPPNSAPSVWRSGRKSRPPGADAPEPSAPWAAQIDARFAAQTTLSNPADKNIAQRVPPRRSGKRTDSSPGNGTLKTQPRRTAKLSVKRPAPPLPALSAGKCLSRQTPQKPVARNAAKKTTKKNLLRGKKKTGKHGMHTNANG